MKFSDLGEVLSQGVSVNPVDNDPIQKGVISIMPDFVGDDTNKEFISGVGLSAIGFKDILSISKPNSMDETIGHIINKSSDVLSLDVTLENIYQNRLKEQTSNNTDE